MNVFFSFATDIDTYKLLICAILEVVRQQRNASQDSYLGRVQENFRNTLHIDGIQIRLSMIWIRT